MKKINIFALVLISAVIFLTQVDFSYAAPSCKDRRMTFDEYKQFRNAGKVSASLRVDGLKAVAIVRNDTNCLIPLTLDTYKMFDTILANQTLFDRTTGVVGQNSTLTVKTDLPGCMAQIDLFLGTSGGQDQNSLGHAGNLIAWLFDQNNGSGYANATGNFCKKGTPLVVSCVANPSSVKTGESIKWTVNASGASGTYTYSWSGTDGLSGQTKNVDKSYSTAGIKNASVVVTSNNKVKTANCSATVTEIVVPQLTVSCSPSSSSVRKYNTVYWNASASGGTGSYAYSWSGTDGLSGSGSSLYKSYSSIGSKTATVTVTSGSLSSSASCDLNVYDDYIPPSYLEGSCSASPYNSQVGSNVSWSASAYGGSGSYYYYWSGTDGLYGNGSYINKNYYTPGYKTATVTISSGSQSITRTCGANISQVLAYTQTNDLPTLTSVYLSDIPYTGIEDSIQILAFLSGLIGFSALLAYFFIRRRLAEVALTNEVTVKSEVEADPMNDKFICNRIVSDKQAFEAVEDMAMNNKIVLSRDAIKTIIKTSRINCTDERELTQKVISACRKDKNQAESEWCLVGDEDVKKVI